MVLFLSYLNHINVHMALAPLTHAPFLSPAAVYSPLVATQLVTMGIF
jgi:hypothetical protein